MRYVGVQQRHEQEQRHGTFLAEPRVQGPQVASAHTSQYCCVFTDQPLGLNTEGLHQLVLGLLLRPWHEGTRAARFARAQAAGSCWLLKHGAVLDKKPAKNRVIGGEIGGAAPQNQSLLMPGVLRASGWRQRDNSGFILAKQTARPAGVLGFHFLGFTPVVIIQYQDFC